MCHNCDTRTLTFLWVVVPVPCTKDQDMLGIASVSYFYGR